MVRFKRILSHPITLAVLFCFLIVSGQSTGFFYLTLLMLGLSRALMHSVLGIAGLLFVLIASGNKGNIFRAFTGLTGAVFMLLSLIRFFTQPGAAYNYPTFHQFVPLIILIAFLLSFMFFVARHLQFLMQKKNRFTSPV